jgi:hypothetical protein
MCELIERKAVTHDTDIYTFKLPDACRMVTPCGHHVYLRFLDGMVLFFLRVYFWLFCFFWDQTIIKPYTVVNESLFKMNENEIKGKVINLMIKYYENGEFTPNLRRLEIGKFFWKLIKF